MPLLDNNGVLGHNKTVCADHLTADDRKNLEGFMKSAIELKAEIQARQVTGTITKTGKARKPRELKVTPNTYIDLFRMVQTYDAMPYKMEDLFIGAIRQHTTGSQHSPYLCFALMRSLREISTEAVFISVNQRRVAGEHIDQKYAQQLALSLRNVIKVFDYHQENISSYIKEIQDLNRLLDVPFNFEEDAAAYLNHVQPAQTTAEKLSMLEQAGLSPDEITLYQAGKRISAGRGHARVRSGLRVTITTDYHQENISSYIREDLETSGEQGSTGRIKWLADLCAYIDTETGELLEWR